MENRSILVVDDEEDVLEFLQFFLSSQGYHVEIETDCRQVIERVKKEDFFLLITDIAMPEMDGYEIINEVLKVKPNTKVAVMTGFGYNPQHTLVQIKEEHKCSCLFKPFNRNKVLKVVEQAFRNYHHSSKSFVDS
jgi:DNA-binding NtrC family response regulator